MSIDRFFTTPVIIVTPSSVTDRYGDGRPDFTNPSASIATFGWLTETGSSEQLGLRDVVQSGWRLFVAADETVTAADRVVAGGRLFAVDGDPHHAHSPLGEHHIEVSLRWVSDIDPDDDDMLVWESGEAIDWEI